MTDSTNSLSNSASTSRIVSDLTGLVIGGKIVRRHADGDVTILFAGLHKRGKPLSFSDISEIEAGRCSGLSQQRSLKGA